MVGSVVAVVVVMFVPSLVGGTPGEFPVVGGWAGSPM